MDEILVTIEHAFTRIEVLFQKNALVLGVLGYNFDIRQTTNSAQLEHAGLFAKNIDSTWTVDSREIFCSRIS